MSDRLYIDPLTNTLREERALFGFAKRLGLSFGAFFRLGVLNYARCLSEAKILSPALNDEYNVISSGDKDYLQRLLNERIEQDKNQKKLPDAYKIDLPKASEPKPIDWSKIPEEKKVVTYIQTVMDEDFRAFWISKYNSADEDERFDVLNQFSDDIVCRFKADKNRPFSTIDIGQIQRVLRTWADAIQGGE